MVRFKLISDILIVIWLCAIDPSLAYDGDICCQRAKNDGMFIGVVPPVENQTCAQSYGPYAAAQPLYVSYAYCKSNCSGVGLSKPYEPREWAAPLVQFILPSVIFSMTIPRRKKIEYDYLFDWPINTKWPWLSAVLQLSRSIFFFLIILLPVIFDTLVWIFVIVTGAGNMLIGGLYEAHLDYRLVGYVQKRLENDKSDRNLEIQRELLVAIASGNLDRDKGDPQVAIPNSLTIAAESNPVTARENSRSRLLNLLGAQSSFGSAVGSPVLFYLGAFVYTILDLLNDRSDQDSAISLGFGIEWMIIVHVAIISGCLLASNNPSTSSGIVGGHHEGMEPPRRTNTLPAAPESENHNRWTWERFCHKILGWSDAYDTEFQPVSLWSRGINKMSWVENSRAWTEGQRRGDEFQKLMKITKRGWFFKIFVPAFLLLVVPPAAGGVVAYYTPPKGIACRSLSMILYAGCQIAVTIIALIKNAVDYGKENDWRWKMSKATWREDVRINIRWLLTGYRFWLISAPWWFFSFLASILGTTMQITGVYRTCICYAGADSWWDVDRVNPMIQLATDTQAKRDASIYWIPAGISATLFMAFNCYIGWWYQRLIRHRFTDAVKAMYVHPDPAPAPTADNKPPPRAAGANLDDGNDGDISTAQPEADHQDTSNQDQINDTGVNTEAINTLHTAETLKPNEAGSSQSKSLSDYLKPSNESPSKTREPSPSSTTPLTRRDHIEEKDSFELKARQPYIG